MLRRFRLEEPESVKEASELLARHGEAARIYAGGTELLLAMKEGLVQYERLINVKKIPGLDQVKLENSTIRIGALPTHTNLEEDPVLKQKLPAFVQMEHNVANVRVRAVGTLGGNLCFAEPHADPGTVLMVLGAKLVAEKASAKREIPAEQFFVDAYETCLEADELLTDIRIPAMPERAGAAYLKFGYLERPSVGVGLFIDWDQGDTIADARIAVGCAGPRPKRVAEAEELLKRKSTKEAASALARAGEVAARAADAIGDLHGSAEYKEHIVGVLLKRAFQQISQQRSSKSQR
ncbi:MAG: xanthine dehydrogenase family protein subunit M [Deltaproteobacteria bacterium]|nr:xanthine dehydrogenase family protein subunit M [Deltaproteobacteria bacterium]